MWPAGTAKLSAYIVFGLFSLVFLVTGLSLPGVTQKALSAIPVVVGLLFIAYDRWLWRLPIVIRLVKRPDLHGAWRGEPTSFRTADNGEELKSTLPFTLVVRQTFTSITITLMSEQSKSTSTVAQVVEKQVADYSVVYQYLNVPSLQYRDLSPIHVGGSELAVAGPRPKQLTAEYWTGRRTRGTFSATWVSSKLAADFQDGQSLLPEKRRTI